MFSSGAYVFGECSESRVVGDVIIVDVDALGDLVVKRFSSGCSQEGDAGDRDWDALFASEEFIAISEGRNMFVEVARGSIGLVWDDLKHPGSVLIDDWEGKVLILLTEIALS